MQKILCATLAFPAVVLAALSPANYVQNGLICHLDGIDNAGTGTHDASATVWKDLTGTTGDFTVNTSCATFTGGNALKKTVSGYMAKYGPRRTDVRTIETAISSIPSSGWLIPFIITRDQCVSFANSGTKRQYCFDDSKYGLTVAATPNPVTVAAVFSSQTAASGFYANGQAPTGSSYKDYWTSSPGDVMSIGGRVDLGYGSDLGVLFAVHAVRLYNRALTATEAQHNYVVDAVRFYGTTPEGYQVTGNVLQWHITAQAAANGKVAMNGGSAGSSATSAWVTSDGSATQVVTLTATPNSGCAFKEWTGAVQYITSGSATSPTITVTADRACALTATFVVSSGAAGEWMGMGVDSRLSTVANWSATTDLTGGTALMKVTGGTEASVPADGTVYAFQGVSVGRDFAFVAEEGAQPVTIGALGVTNTANATWSWPTTLATASNKTVNDKSTTAQIWYTGTEKSLAIRAPLSGSALYFQGRGRVDVYSTNEIDVAFVGGSNSGEPGAVQVYQQPGARLVKDGGTVNCSCKAETPYTWGFHLMGGTHNYNILAGTHNNGNPSAFFVEAGTTNVLTGSFTTQWSNESTMGIKGYLAVQGGLTATSSANAQGCWRPFSRYDSSYKTGYLKVESKPMTANRVCIPWGTLELAAAGNTFATRGLYIEDRGLVKTTVADALEKGKDNKLKLTGGTLDLCGNDQGVDLFCGNGGTVTSATAAQLHVDNSTYFFDSKFSSGQPASSPALNLGTNMTVCTTVFTGQAGLAKEGTQDLYIAAENTSSGTLTVANGTVILSMANSVAKYPGTSFAKTKGSWAGRIEVAGGLLVVEHGGGLTGTAELYVSDGQVDLPEGCQLLVSALYVADGQGGWTQLKGTYGGPESGVDAVHQPVLPGTSTPVFTGKGQISVGTILPGGWPTATTEANWTGAGSDTLVTTAANWDPNTVNLYNGTLLAHFAAGTAAKLPDNEYLFINGLEFTQKDFRLESGADTLLSLGPAGVTNKTAGVVWNWPAMVGEVNPLWWLDKNSTLELRAPLVGNGEFKVWGGGRMDVYSTNVLQGAVYVGDSNDQSANPIGEVYVWLHPGAQLAPAGSTLKIGTRAGWGLHLMGNTLGCNVIAGTQNTSNPGALFVEAGTTNVIEGSFATQYSNLSYMGIAGHLTIRGGATLQKGCMGAMQRFRPLSAETGTLRIENLPAESGLFEVYKGRLELAAAGNKFMRQGLWINSGTVFIDADNAIAACGKTTGNDNNSLQISSGLLDLNGHDIQLDAFNGRGGMVASATAAQLRIKDDYLQTYTGGQVSNYVKPYLSTGTVCQTIFTERAGLTKEGSQTFYLAAVNTSTGTLAVTAGRLVMSAYSATEAYPGTEIKKTYGSWGQGGRVEVSGGTLVIEHKDAFGRDVPVYLSGSGTIEVAEGVSARTGLLYINGVCQRDGTYGGPESPATNKPMKDGKYLFSGKGVIRVIARGGFTLILSSTGPSKSGSVSPVADTEGASLRFGVVSDIHITRRGAASDTYSYGSAQTFVHLLQYYKEKNVDAVVIAGDLADRGLPENLEVVASAWREVFPTDTAADGRPVTKIFIYGNHDSDKSWFKNSSGVLSGKTEAEQAELVARSISMNESNCWVRAWGEDWNPVYTKTVKGYRFVAAHWGHEAEAADILNRDYFELAGSKPFFYIQHPQLTDGLYGSAVWGSAKGPMTALSSLPNAITFSGHSHYTTSLEASIFQNAFTSIGTGSLSYMDKFGGGLNASANTRNSREALLVTVFGSRVVVKRREFVKDADLGPDWEIQTPPATHGSPYTYAHEQERLLAPTFPETATLQVERVAEGLKLTLPRAIYDAGHVRAPWFDVVFSREDTTLYTCVLQQNAYFAPYEQVPATTVYTLPSETFADAGTLTVTIRARDFYGRTSAPLSCCVLKE